MNPLDSLINEIEESQKEIQEIPQQTKEIVEKKDPADMSFIAKTILEKINTNDKIAEEIYKLFYDSLVYDKDKSTSSKEALLRSLELRIQNNSVLAELAKAVAKRDGGRIGVGVAINTNEGTAFGISLDKINKEL